MERRQGREEPRQGQCELVETREIEGTDGNEPGVRDVETRQTAHSGGLQQAPGLGPVVATTVSPFRRRRE